MPQLRSRTLPPSLLLSTLIGPDGPVTLTIPVTITVRRVREGILCANDDLHLYACAPTLDEAIQEWQEKFFMAYHGYTTSSPEELTESALQLRHRFLTILPRTYAATDLTHTS
jgi:hypothetical protein